MSCGPRTAQGRNGKAATVRRVGATIPAIGSPDSPEPPCCGIELRLTPVAGKPNSALRQARFQLVRQTAPHIHGSLTLGLPARLQSCERSVVLRVANSSGATMARNPLILSFMCLTAIQRQAEGRLEDFPTRAAPLIGECVDALVKWHSIHKVYSGWPDSLLAPTVTRVLAPLALGTFKDGSGVIKERSLDELGDDEAMRGQTAPHRLRCGAIRLSARLARGRCPA